MPKHKPIKLPDKIKIGWRYVNITREAPTFTNDANEEYGSWSGRKNTLNFHPQLKFIQLANAIIHELDHIAFDDLSLNAETKSITLLSEDLEELIANGRANHFVSICLDNKWFLPFLQQLIHGEDK